MTRILGSSKNFALVEVSGLYDASATEITLQTGEGAKLPNPSTDGSFSVVWWNVTDYPEVVNDPNKEIVLVTARTGDVITITRAQEGTSASTKNVSGRTYKMANTFTAGDKEKIENAINTHALTEKTTPVDADEFALVDSASSNVLKRLTWANVKATLLSYFQGAFGVLANSWDGWVSISGTLTASDANTISVNSDITGKIQKGDKIKLTNNSAVKYFYVTTTPVFSSPNTTFDVTGEVDLVAGAITLPYFSKIESPQGFIEKPIVRLQRSTNQSIGTSSFTVVQLGTQIFASNGVTVDLANYRFTVKIAGIYHIIGRVQYQDFASGSRHLEIFINGSLGLGGIFKSTDPANRGYVTTSSLYYLSKGDYVQLRSFQESGSTINLQVAEMSAFFVSV